MFLTPPTHASSSSSHSTTTTLPPTPHPSLPPSFSLLPPEIQREILKLLILADIEVQPTIRYTSASFPDDPITSYLPLPALGLETRKLSLLFPQFAGYFRFLVQKRLAELKDAYGPKWFKVVGTTFTDRDYANMRCNHGQPFAFTMAEELEEAKNECIDCSILRAHMGRLMGLSVWLYGVTESVGVVVKEKVRSERAAGKKMARLAAKAVVKGGADVEMEGV